MNIFRFICTIFLAMINFIIYALPNQFVYLKDVDPSILQEMRYAGYHNFIGRPIKGYETGTCILTKPAAQALSKVQHELLKQSLSLKVYDCYRPTMAVLDFITWSRDVKHQEMKQEFYPAINKADMFRLGYVAEKSGHSRGSTVDLTINSLEMGTNYDYMDTLSHADNREINAIAYQHRMLLRTLMMKHGFQPYEKEWWHFTLDNEPYPNTYFNFKVK